MLETQNQEALPQVPHPSQSELIGHSETLSIVERILNSKEAHHAIMLVGKKGIGKATLIYNVLKKILTEYDSKANTGKNSVAMLIANSHPDIYVLEALVGTKGAKAEISVDQVRDLIEFARLTPAYLERKYIIIDPIDSLNTNASNAILKILEEPPTTVQFLITCNNRSGVMETINSRCMVLHCQQNRPMENLAVLSKLGIQERQAKLLLTLAENSISGAIEISNSNGIAIYKAILLDISSEHNTCEKIINEAQTTDYQPMLKHFIQRALIGMIKMVSGFLVQEELTEFEIEFLERYINTKYPTVVEIANKIEKCTKLMADSETFSLGDQHITQALLHIIRS